MESLQIHKQISYNKSFSSSLKPLLFFLFVKIYIIKFDYSGERVIMSNEQKIMPTNKGQKGEKPGINI